MKSLRTILLVGATVASFLARPVRADDTVDAGGSADANGSVNGGGASVSADASVSASATVVVEKGKVGEKTSQEVKTLIKAFEAKRDKFVAEEKALTARLKTVSGEQREFIRDRIQDNRQAFLADVRLLRQELREELNDLKGKVRNDELKRLIDAAKDVGDGHHHGKQ